MSNKIFEWIERYLSSKSAENNPNVESESGAQQRVDEHEQLGSHEQIDVVDSSDDAAIPYSIYHPTYGELRLRKITN